MKSLSDLLAPLSDPTDRLRLEAFGQMYTTPGHLWLARCAAFPVALTTDLLYKIWLNFRQTDTGETIDIPINAVGDILLSPLCHEIGYDLYEMYPEARAVLWQSLSPDAVASLAEFTLRYLDFCRDKVPSEAFAEAQRIWAESFQHPQKVAQLLRQLLSERKTNSGSKIMADYVLSWVKNRNQWANQKGEATTAQRDSLSDLAQMAEGIQQYEKGDITEAKATFSSIAHLLQAPRAGGFNVPIAKEIWQNLPMNATAEPQKGKIYAVLVGIDEYGEKLENKRFNGCVNDVLSWETLLKERFQSESTVSLTNSDATKEAIINALQDIFIGLRAVDTLLFTFSGHAHNKELPHLLATYDTDAAQKGSYLSENEFRSLISQTGSQNPFVTVILDTHAGSSGWIDTNNEKHILLAATANGEISMEVDKKGLLTATLQSILDENKYYPITYQKLIRESFRKIKKANYKQTPQLFGHYNAITLTFLANSLFYDTYWHELLAVCGYSNSENKTIKVTAQNIADEFGPEMTAGNINTMLEKYALLKGTEKIKVVRISSKMSVRQIPIFQREYLKSLPYEVEIKDISLFHHPTRSGLKKAASPIDGLQDNLSSLQDAHIIVFILNQSMTYELIKHTTVAPFINYLSRFEYKVVCSIMWEDCDWQRTVLKDYPVFSKKEPLVRSLTGFETELEIKRHYEHDWQPVVNKWIKDLTLLNILSENTEGLQKEFERRLSRMRVANPQHIKYDDPQKDLWGGKSENKGFKINVTVKPEPNSDRYFSIYISLQQTENSNLSASKAAFFLHNTFSPMNMVVPFVENKADFSLISYEAFTLGVMTDTGVELEVDLNEISGLPAKFYYSKNSLPVIYLAYDNSEYMHLSSLKNEVEKVYETLQERAAKQGFIVISGQFATKDKIFETLLHYERSICILSISSQIGRNQLSLDDNSLSENEFAIFLGKCTNLKLVILNGYSTDMELKSLLDNGVPIVIGTHTTISDETASRFAIDFFKFLSVEQKSIQEAFSRATDILRVYSHIDEKDIQIQPSGFLEESSHNSAAWGLYYNPEQAFLLTNWKL